MFDVHRQLSRPTLVLIIAIGVHVAAEAQEVASSLAQLRELVTTGDDVFVTDLQGRQTQGSVAEISSSSLGLIVGRTRIDFAIGDLETVSRRDSRWNGTLWGLGVGGVLGVLLDRELVREYGREDISLGESAVFIVQAAGLGAGIGFGVDAMIKGRRLIYSRSQTSMSGVATVTPIWGNGRKGVFVLLQL